MPHLRAPALRADRREGGRHGRPAARPAPSQPPARIRPRLLPLAVLPAAVIALGAGAAVLYTLDTLRSTGQRPPAVLWAVLAGAAAMTLAALLTAALAARRATRSVRERLAALRADTARRQAELTAVLEALRHGEEPPPTPRRGEPPARTDAFHLLADDLARAHDGAVAAVVEAGRLSGRAGSEQKLEVFVDLARRLQSLVHREISLLDELENEIEDPELLKGLFHVDHLATRIRRHAENLAVLGGAVSRRQWSNPVPMTEVLRSAIAEVEQYSRVRLVPPVDGRLRGHAVADVIHLLAELVENATVFSAPHTEILLRANHVTAGLAVEVEDRGLGMPVAEQVRMNELLADPDQVDVAGLLADGRIGLYVVSQLARRHGITVRLQTNIYGGVQAVLVLPRTLLGADPDVTEPYGADVPESYGAGAEASEPYGAGVPQPYGAESDTAAPAADVPPTASAGHGRAAEAAPATAAATGQGGPGGPGAPGTAVGTPAASAGTPAGPVDAPAAATAPSPSVAPAPPSRRDSGSRRPAPAREVPGPRPGDPAGAAGREGVLPAPRDGSVPGTEVKPPLPRRRARHHLAPQLRSGPAPRRHGDDTPSHDPGLMAEFRRGVGLAEARQHQDGPGTDQGPYDQRPYDLGPSAPGPVDTPAGNGPATLVPVPGPGRAAATGTPGTPAGVLPAPPAGAGGTRAAAPPAVPGVRGGAPDAPADGARGPHDDTTPGVHAPSPHDATPGAYAPGAPGAYDHGAARGRDDVPDIAPAPAGPAGHDGHTPAG